MPFVTIHVTGLTDIMRGIGEIMRSAPQTNKAILDETTDLFVRTAKSKAHVITGRTKASVRGQPVTTKQSIVEAHWGAKWEELRSGSKGAQGPHKFFTESAAVVKRVMPDIIKRHYDQLIRRVQSG